MQNDELVISPGIKKFYAIIALATGALRMLSIPLVGQMPVSELILLTLVAHTVLWLVLYHRMPAQFAQPRVLGLLVLCQLIALSGYVVSDFWRGSYPVDMVRGWLRMIFLLIDIGALALLFGSSPITFILIQVGTCLSSFQFLFMRPLFGDYWKFAFGAPVTVMVLLLAPRFLGYWFSILACSGLGLLHIAMDFRSMAAICLLVAAMQLFFMMRPIVRKFFLSTISVVLLVSLPWIAALMFGETVGRANRSNVERSAMLQAAWEAFVESPIIGHGSWFSRSTVMDNFLSIRKQQSTIAGGGGMGFDHTAFDGITIHSQILTALAEGGIFGGIFFMALTFLIIWSLWYCLVVTSWTWQTPIRLFVLTCSLFDVVMAPFSGTHRLNISITTALTLLLLAEARRRKEKLALEAEMLHKSTLKQFGKLAKGII